MDKEKLKCENQLRVFTEQLRQVRYVLFAYL